MSVPFVTRPPSAREVERIRLTMSVFCDGSGQEMESDGSTRPGWRDIERAFACALGGAGPENKAVFDVIVPSSRERGVDYGLSIKSKTLSRRTALGDLEVEGRVYMELTNSPAKLWAPLEDRGFTETHFRNQQNPADIGNIVMETVQSWHHEARQRHPLAFPNRVLNLSQSVYVTVSMDDPRPGRRRQYQIHSFSLAFPRDIMWSYRSARCLRGTDPAFPDEPLVDWYALSGGQLKYYPRASACLFRSAVFELARPPRALISERAAAYWPAEWAAASERS